MFYDLLDYFYPDVQGEEKELLADRIRRKLDSKIDKMIAHELFTKYKRTPTGAERETARQAYMEHKGIFKDYQTVHEHHIPEPDGK